MGVMLKDLRSVRGSLGSLQSLEMRIESWSDRMTIDAFEFAPRLTRIKLTRSSIRQKFIFPWSQLISYHEELEQSRSTDLKIPSFGPLGAADDTSKVPRISHSAIRHLLAKSHSMIPFITLPSLEILTLDVETHTAPEATLDVRHLIRRSDCSLTELNLRGITPGKEVVELLRCTPKLTRLAFHYGYSQWKHNVNEDFINLFRVVDVRRENLPQKLQSLSITIGQHPGKIKSWWGAEQLPEFNFVTDTATLVVSSRTIEQLQGFKEEGMRISIRAKMADSGQQITYI
ncbi:hypothetical protein ARMSODRAFT_976202 [Armillaria solidipes]|uniref:F-box domain-containing protein n=1 Tax=Armillaria solidipes TaxID=1076256 RepID=A0A2H3BAJ7_9AGAR|nr:hypothetical protein ARMSODRAFT_976202 [Armillaria solidipes]